MSITRQRKETMVASLTEDLRRNGTFVLADFTGINVQDMTELRRTLRERGVLFSIVKNTLLNRVLKNLELNTEEQVFGLLEGPTALASSGDEVLPAKVLKEFAAAHEGRPVIKGGYVGGKSYSAAQVVSLADLPGREELLARVLGSATAPIRGFVTVSGGVLRKLLYALEAIRESKTS